MKPYLGKPVRRTATFNIESLEKMVIGYFPRNKHFMLKLGYIYQGLRQHSTCWEPENIGCPLETLAYAVVYR